MVQERARVRLIGLPTDSHSSFLRGAAAAPPAIRAALHSDHGNMATECGLEIGQDLLLEDVGDLPLDETDKDLGRIANAARSPEDSRMICAPSGSFRTMSKNMCAGTVVDPPGATSAAIVSVTSISRSVAFNESLERSPCKSTLARIGIVLRRSTTRWTCPKDFNNSERSTVTFIVKSMKKAETQTTKVA